MIVQAQSPRGTLRLPPSMLFAKMRMLLDKAPIVLYNRDIGEILAKKGRIYFYT
jgi:hypothetical protein